MLRAMGESSQRSTSAPRGRPGLVAVVVLILVAGLGVACGWTSTWTELMRSPEARAELTDFQILYAAGQGLVEGRDIHDPHVLDQLGRRVGRDATPFCAYNPLVVRAFGLFDAGDYHGSFRVWELINRALLLLTLALLAVALQLEGLPKLLALCVAVAALALNDSIWMSRFYNQMNGVALVAIVAALVAAQRRRYGMEGVMLAVAVCAKTSPMLLVLVAAMAGRWRSVAWAAGTGLVLFAISLLWSGTAVHVSYVEQVLPKLGYAPAEPTGFAFTNSFSAWNLAPNGLISRHLFRAGDASAAAGWAWGVSLVVLGVLGATVIRRRGRDPFADYALGVAAMFLVSSVTWPHHLGLVALPVTWLAARSWSRGLAWGNGLLAAAATVVLFLPLYAFAPGEGRGAIMDDVTPETEEQDMRARSLALAALFAVCAGAGERRSKDPPDA